MIRVLGAILLLSGAAGWGLRSIVRLRGRAQTLTAIAASLTWMETEIRAQMTPTPELLELLARESAYPADAFYRQVLSGMKQLGERPFAEVWRTSLLHTPGLVLEPGDTLLLAELGVSLGKYDADAQAQAVRHVRQRAELLSREACAARDRDSRVHAAAGVAAGVFAVMILL